jgi:hypothetical protein
MPKGIYPRKPRKPVTPVEAASKQAEQIAREKLQGQSEGRLNAALDSLALCRDYCAVIETGLEDKQDLPQLAGEAKRAANQAGEQLENVLRSLGLLSEEREGWFLRKREEQAAVSA